MNTIRPTDDEWMSLADFAKIVGKSVATLYNERARGLDFPPSYDFNKKSVRLRRSDVDAWLEKFRRVPAAVQLQQATG
jgi:predicted DNA-binding transcriptional regulator AlpA